MSSKKNLVLGGLLAASLCIPAGVAAASPEDPAVSPAGVGAPKGAAPADARDDARPCFRERRRMRHEHRRNGAVRAARALRILDLTDAQKDAVRAARTETEAERDALRASVRAVREKARDGERTPEARKAAREEVRAAVRAAADRVAPVARRLVDGLAPEQRARLEAKAREHGKSLDDAKLLRLFERLLLAPGRRAQAPADR